MNAQLTPIRTLVVDDSQAECALMGATLRSFNLVELVGFVHDGFEAISYLRGIGQFKDRQMFPYPDLLLLDFNMPRCGGMEFLQFLQPPIRKPRIVLWSNTLERVCVPLALRLGADVVCHKPADKHELGGIIDRMSRRIFNSAPTSRARRQSEVLCANVQPI